MKAYYDTNRLQLVGKAWEVRHQLRQLAKAAAQQEDGSLGRLLRQRGAEEPRHGQGRQATGKTARGRSRVK